MARKPFNRITRRGFIAGAAATAAATAATAVPLSLSGCSGDTSTSEELTQQVKAQFPDAQVEFFEVDDSQILPYVDMNNVESADYLSQTNSFELPLGSLVHQSSDNSALVLVSGSSSRAIIELGFVDLNTGELITVLEQALGFNEDYIIYDARASADALIWVECNMVHGLWRVYATTYAENALDAESLQKAQLLDEGGEDYMPPWLAAAHNKVYWTVMPDPNGPASSEDSYLKTAELSANKKAEPHVVFTSHGRMITIPVVSGDMLTFVPRVDTDLVYYQLTTLDTSTDTVQNIAILPQSLRVAHAAWLGEGFAFSIENNYDYAGGLSLFGTYEQLKDGDFLYVNKSPVSAPVQLGELTCVKSTKNVLGINTQSGSVAIVDTPQNCVDYGDILAGCGMQNRLVLYTTITTKTGQASGTCNVRVYDLL